MGPPEMSPEVRYGCNYAIYSAFIGATTQGFWPKEGKGGGQTLSRHTPDQKTASSKRWYDQSRRDKVVEPGVEARKMCWHYVIQPLSLVLL